MRKLMPLAAALSLAGSGCSLSLDTSKLDPLKTPDGYCKVLMDEALRHAATCYSATQQWFDANYGQATTLCDGLARAEARGTIVYDEGAARAWIEKIRSASCTTNVDDLMNHADAPLVGQVPDGGGCADRIECADDRAECKYVHATCPGTCMAPGVQGDPCDVGYPPCDTGYYCDLSTNGYSCQKATPTGGDCSMSGSNCGQRAYCWNCPSCNPLNQCRPYVAEGGMCNSSDRQCDPGNDIDLFCDDLNSGTCKRYRTLVLGQRCHGNGECDGATFCSAGRCVQRFGSGSSCTSEQCMPPLDCIGDSMVGAGKCLPRPGLGAQCLAGSYDCGIGAYCTATPGTTQTTCQPFPSAYDQQCGAIGSGLEWAPCLVGWCDTGTSTSGVCRPFRTFGASCGDALESCGGDMPGSDGRCSWAIVGKSPVQVCISSCP